ncbi:MAG: heme biosynthesis HemY N-terminal domain-containing protein [Pseudomonadota bacterium]
MKTMLSLVLAVGLALLAIWALPLLRGYVLIRADGWAIEMNVFVLLASLASLYILIRLGIWLWYLPGNAVRGFFQRRAAAQLEIGMLALSEGNWQKAEKALSKAARKGDQSALSYIGAAQAAAGTGHEGRADEYLQHADQSSKAHDSVLITRASLQLSANHPDEALATLNELGRTKETRPRVLELKARALEQLERWTELAAIAPALTKAKIIDDEQQSRLEHKALLAALEGAQDSAALTTSWKNLSRSQRQEVVFLKAYAANAAALGASDMAEKDLRSALGRQWSDELLDHFVIAAGEDPKLTTQLEKWLAKHPDSAGLHRHLGRQLVLGERYAKAKEHLETSVNLSPSPDAWAELAELKAHQGDTEGALACYRQASQKSALPLGPALLTADGDQLAPAADQLPPG